MTLSKEQFMEILRAKVQGMPISEPIPVETKKSKSKRVAASNSEVKRSVMQTHNDMDTAAAERFVPFSIPTFF